MFQAIFGCPTKPTPVVQGVLSLEYCGKPSATNDGLCVTLLLLMLPPDPNNPAHPLPIKHPDKYEWQDVGGPEVKGQLLERLELGLFVPLLLLR